jgi:hypothetical protein
MLSWYLPILTSRVPLLMRIRAAWSTTPGWAVRSSRTSCIKARRDSQYISYILVSWRYMQKNHPANKGAFKCSQDSCLLCPEGCMPRPVKNERITFKIFSGDARVYLFDSLSNESSHSSGRHVHHVRFLCAVTSTVLGLLANLKETREVKRACQVEATRIRSVVNK